MITIVIRFSISLKSYWFQRLVLFGQEKPIRQQAGAEAQRAVGADPRKFWKIITFREMGQNHVGCLAIVAGRKKLRCRFIGKMADAR